MEKRLTGPRSSIGSVLFCTGLLVSTCTGQILSQAPLPVELSTLQYFTTLVPKYSAMTVLTPNLGESRLFQSNEKNVRSFLTVDAIGIHVPETLEGLNGPKATYGFRPETKFRKYGVAPTLISSRNSLAERILGINQKEGHFYVARQSLNKAGDATKSIALDMTYGDLRCEVTINGKSVLAKIEFDVHESLVVSQQFYAEAFGFQGEQSIEKRRLCNDLDFCGTQIPNAVVLITKSDSSPITIGFDLIRRLHSEFSFEPGTPEWTWVEAPVGFQMPNQYRFDFIGYMTPRGLQIDDVMSWGVAAGILLNGDVVSEIGRRNVRQRLVCYCQEAIANEIVSGGSLKLSRAGKWISLRLPGDPDAIKKRIGAFR